MKSDRGAESLMKCKRWRIAPIYLAEAVLLWIGTAVLLPFIRCTGDT